MNDDLIGVVTSEQLAVLSIIEKDSSITTSKIAEVLKLIVPLYKNVLRT